jgi:hypothetical protein
VLNVLSERTDTARRKAGKNNLNIKAPYEEAIDET